MNFIGKSHSLYYIYHKGIKEEIIWDLNHKLIIILLLIYH